MKTEKIEAKQAKETGEYTLESWWAERQKLEAQARQAYIANGGHAGLSALEASERFDKLIDAQTDAQLRKYISRHK